MPQTENGFEAKNLQVTEYILSSMHKIPLVAKLQLKVKMIHTKNECNP